MITYITPLSTWLADFAALATVLLVTVHASRWLIRGAAERMVVAWSAWLGLAVLAALTALPNWPRLALITSPTTQRGSRIPLSQPLELEVVALLSSEMKEPSPGEVRPTESSSLVSVMLSSWQSLVVLAWLSLSALALGWIALGMAQTWRLLWRSTSAPPWIAGELRRLVPQRRRLPSVRLSRQLASAAAVGAFHPRILLPRAADDEACASAVRAALAHEWAHIHHGDLWLLALERLLIPLLAWHPLFWFLRRSVRLDQELLADAAAAGSRPVEYAEALLAWAKSARPAPLGVAALSLWESPHTLSRRVTMLLDPNRPAATTANRGWQLLLAAASLLFVGGLSVVTLRPLTADEPPAAASPAPGRAAPLPAAEAPAQIAMQCIVAEVPVDVLVEVLPEVNNQPQPSPALAVVVRSQQKWREALDEFQNDARTSLISRPQIQTLDGQNSIIRMAMPVAGVDEADAKKLGLTIDLTPHLLPNQGDQRQVRIQVQAQQTVLASNGGDEQRVRTTREFKTSATVPDGMTLIVADRSRAPAAVDPTAPASNQRKVLVLAFETQIVPAPSAPQPSPEPRPSPQPAPARGEPSPDFSKLFQGPLDDEAKLKAYLLRQIETLKQLHETDHNRLQAASREFEARFAQLQSLAEAVQQYNRDRDETGLLKKQLTELRMQIDRLLSETPNALPSAKPAWMPLPSSRAADHPNLLKIALQNAKAERVADALRTIKYESAGPSPDVAIKTREVEGQLNAAQESLSTVHQQLTRANLNLAQQERVRLEAEEAKLRAQIKSLSEQLKLLKERGVSEATPLRVFADPATNSVSVFGPLATLEAAKAIAEALDQPSQSSPHSQRALPQAGEPKESRPDDRDTQIKLMELDLKDAEVSLEAAKAELDASMEIRQTNPRAFSAAEITKAQLGVRRAEIQVEKMKLLLDGLKKQPDGPAPHTNRQSPNSGASDPFARPR